MIDKEGNHSNYKALSNIGYGMEDEAIRIIKESPKKWIPGLQNGKRVPVIHKAYISFIIDKSKADVNSSSILNLPKISITALQKASAYDLTQLEPGTEISTFIFTIDNSMGGIYESVNTGNDLNLKTKELIRNAKPGLIFTIDNITIIKEGVKKKLPSRVFEISEDVNKDAPKVTKTQDKTRSFPGYPKIAIKDLQKATAYDLTWVEPGTAISTFTFAMDNPKGFIDESVNTGSYLNFMTKELIKNAKSGRTITIDNIYIVKDGVKKKIPSKVYFVTN
jgi:hypothetical protein